MTPADPHPLLVSCVRHSLQLLPPLGDVPAPAPPPPVDLLELADRHHLMPHLACAAAILPEPLRPQLDAWQHRWTRLSLALSAELARLTRALDQAGVDVLPLKGPALGEYLYADPARRSYTDLDLFLRSPAHRDRALAVLTECGYNARWQGPTAALHRRFDWYLEMPLRHAARGFDVDLHWGLTPRHYPAQIDEARLWHRAASMEFAGTRVRVPHAADYLEYLCLHGERHGWSALGWVADVAALVSRRGKELGDRPPATAAAWHGWQLAHRIIGGIPAPPGAPPPGPSWRKRLAYRAAVTFIPTEADWAGPVQLPPSLAPLYYPLRLARLAVRRSTGAS